MKFYKNRKNTHHRKKLYKKKSLNTIVNSDQIDIECQYSPHSNSNSVSNANSNANNTCIYDPELENNSLMKEFTKYASSVSNPRNNEAKRISKLLNYTYFLKYNDNLTSDEIENWSYNLIGHNAELINPYINHMRSYLNHKDGTILNFCNVALDLYYKFFTLIRSNCSIHLTINEAQENRFHATLHEIKKSARKGLKPKKFKKTKKQRIQERKLPSGNQIKVINKAVRDRLEWVTQIKENPCHINDTTYTKYLQLLFASFYITPQGRPGALATVQVQHFNDLMNSYYEADKFKTSSTYGIQPIILNKKARYILEIYFKFLRPMAVTNSGNFIFINSELSPLFIDYNGKPISDFGRYVTAFYTQWTGLNINITALRELFDTISNEKYNNGDITHGQYKSIARTIGHSIETSERCYVLNDTRLVVKDVESGNLGNDSDDDDNDIDLSQYEGIDYNIQYEPINWGTLHPDFNSSNTRIKFSKQEIKYVKSLVQRYCPRDQLGNYSVPPRFVTTCLEKIKADPAAIPHFHERHVLNSTRLRSLLRSMKIGVK